MRSTHALMLTLAASLVGAATAQDKPKAPDREPIEAAVAAATKSAAAKNRRVLVTFTGQDELSGQLLAALKKELHRQMLYEFFVVPADNARDAAYATTLKLTVKPDGGPALAVLDGSGKLLGNLTDADLTDDAGNLATKQLGEQLTKFHAAPIDATKVLADALADAKKTGRAVFIHFDAPW